MNDILYCTAEDPQELLLSLYSRIAFPLSDRMLLKRMRNIISKEITLKGTKDTKGEEGIDISNKRLPIECDSIKAIRFRFADIIKLMLIGNRV